MHGYDVKPSNATFYGGWEHITNNLSFSLKLGKILTIQVQEKSPTFSYDITFKPGITRL